MNVVLCDLAGRPIGTMEKNEAHQVQRGTLHLAVSVLLICWKDGELQVLTQQRAACKYHCPLLWANACCTHPRWDERFTPLKAGKRRLGEEMGIFGVELQPLLPFTYSTLLPGSQMVEREFDYLCFAEVAHGVHIQPNPLEVADYRWMTAYEILRGCQTRSFAPWFKIIVEQLLDAPGTFVSQRPNKKTRSGFLSDF